MYTFNARVNPEARDTNSSSRVSRYIIVAQTQTQHDPVPVSWLAGADGNGPDLGFQSFFATHSEASKHTHTHTHTHMRIALHLLRITAMPQHIARYRYVGLRARRSE